MQKIISVSVHQIVDYVLRSGNIDNRIFNTETMEEGTMVHQYIQSLQDDSYIPEYPLETLFPIEDCELDIQGRADGFIKDKNGNITIDEIKSTVSDLKSFAEANASWHQGQAKMYAWIYARNNNVKDVTVRMTYVQQHKMKNTLIFENKYSFEELDAFAKETIAQYYENFRFRQNHLFDRNQSIKFSEFPFPNYRNGQQDLISFADRISQENAIGFVEAPTGIGKTVSVLYPYIRNLANDLITQPNGIYYLTSKTSIRRQALLTIRKLIEKKMDLICVTFTSKEAICLNLPNLKRHCNPVECPFAIAYYDKVKKAIREALDNESVFDTEDFIKIAQKYTICPYQLQLDLAQYADVIICDYNYIYDPAVNKFNAMEQEAVYPYYLLVDEAHNLPNRAREMYSTNLTVEELKDLVANLEEFKKKPQNILTYLHSLLSFFASLYDENCKEAKKVDAIPDELLALIKLLTNGIDEFEKKHGEEDNQDYAFISNNLLDLNKKLKELNQMPVYPEENYLYYFKYDLGGNAISFEASCLDARKYIQSITSTYVSTIFFSATLSPQSYYINLLGGLKTPPENTICLPSPFNMNQRLVLVDTSVSIKYKDREATLNQVCQKLYVVANGKKGNYLFFFPSFSYLEMVYKLFETNTSFKLVKQKRNLTPLEKNEFIDSFSKDSFETTIGFAVLGGVFSEGIEMSRNALQGVCIVSVGLPAISFSNNALKDYYSANHVDGFDYAYTYPGFNKVVQAAGRVIRDFSDKGVILLIDKRYAEPKYQELLKDVFPDRHMVKTANQMMDLIAWFWGE